MNTSEPIPVSPEPSLMKLPFRDVIVLNDLDFQTLSTLAQRAQVNAQIVYAMINEDRVRRLDAEKVLKALSWYIDPTSSQPPWTLDTVEVMLFPTFTEICERHHVDIPTLASHVETGTSLAFCTLDMLLAGTPVPKDEAIIMLEIVSSLVRQNYTLEGVDIPLMP